MVRRSASEMLSALGPRFSEEGACRSPVPESTTPITTPSGPQTPGVVKRSAELVKHCYPSLRSTGGTPPANDGLGNEECRKHVLKFEEQSQKLSQSCSYI